MARQTPGALLESTLEMKVERHGDGEPPSAQAGDMLAKRVRRTKASLTEEGGWTVTRLRGVAAREYREEQLPCSDDSSKERRTEAPTGEVGSCPVKEAGVDKTRLKFEDHALPNAIADDLVEQPQEGKTGKGKGKTKKEKERWVDPRRAPCAAAQRRWKNIGTFTKGGDVQQS